MNDSQKKIFTILVHRKASKDALFRKTLIKFMLAKNLTLYISNSRMIS